MNTLKPGDATTLQGPVTRGAVLHRFLRSEPIGKQVIDPARMIGPVVQ